MSNSILVIPFEVHSLIFVHLLFFVCDLEALPNWFIRFNIQLVGALGAGRKKQTLNSKDWSLS